MIASTSTAKHIQTSYVMIVLRNPSKNRGAKNLDEMDFRTEKPMTLTETLVNKEESSDAHGLAGMVVWSLKEA